MSKFKKKAVKKFQKKAVSKRTTNELTHLMNLCKKLLRITADYHSKIEVAEEIKTEMNHLRLDLIPDFAGSIGESGMPKFTLGSGESVEIKDDLKCAISEANTDKALAFIKKMKSESIIKTEISIVFDGEDKEELQRLKALLKENDFLYNDKPSINNQTLKSWLKGLRTNGNKDLKPEVFGIHDFKEVKIKGVKFK